MERSLARSRAHKKIRFGLMRRTHNTRVDEISNDLLSAALHEVVFYFFFFFYGLKITVDSYDKNRINGLRELDPLVLRYNNTDAPEPRLGRLKRRIFF